MNILHAGLLIAVLAGSLSVMPGLAQEAPKAGNVKTFKENERKPKNDYNIKSEWPITAII